MYCHFSRFSGISPLVFECSPDRTDSGTSPTEIAFPLRVMHSRRKCRAGFLTFPAVDAGFCPTQPEPAELCEEGEEHSKGTDDPADRTVNKY